jgi:hypothetical protein
MRSTRFSVTVNCGATFRKAVPAQPVDATPAGINLSPKGGVHETRETMEVSEPQSVAARRDFAGLSGALSFEPAKRFSAGINSMPAADLGTKASPRVCIALTNSAAS